MSLCVSCDFFFFGSFFFSVYFVLFWVCCCYLLFPVCFQMRKRKGVELVGGEVGEELGGVGGEDSMSRIPCIKNYF